MKRGTRLFLLLLSVLWASAVLGAGGGPDYGDPTDEEQYMLELVNRARMNPTAEGLRLGMDLSGYPPVPPVAMDGRLVEAARAHAEDMATRLFFGHMNPDGVNANGRIRAQGYVFPIGYGPDDVNETENIRAQGPNGVDAAHKGLMASEGHRRNILSGSYAKSFNDQVGIGIWSSKKDVVIEVEGVKKTFREFYAQEFAYDDQELQPFVLGVVYRDKNKNGFYDPKEGIGGITVETQGGGFVTTSATAGGYAIPVGIPGEYTLVASGPGLPVPIEKPVTIGESNVKVDFVVGSGGGPPSRYGIQSAVFKVDFKKRAKGVKADSLKLKVVLDKSSLPANLAGSQVTLDIGDLVLGPYTLAGNGKKGSFKSAKGVTPKVSLQIQAKSGKLSLKTSKADLMAGLGIENVTATGVRIIDIRTRVGAAHDATEPVTFVMKSTERKKATGKKPK